ncbi:MAG: glutaminase, partial [Thermoanaerobaculia bacterium]
MDWQRILEEIREEVEPLTRLGRVADYIPPLAEVPVERFGMALRTTEGQLYKTGDADVPFSVQSVAKVFLLTVAMRYEGDEIWNRVGREPSGNPFHSLILLERENGVPRNPFINAGAMVLTDIVLTHMTAGTDPLLELVRAAAGDGDAVY